MKRRIGVIILLLVTHNALDAQKLLGNAGIGIGYDAFIPDKSVLAYHNKWPFEPGIESMFGVKYLPENGFQAFLQCTAGTINVQIPAPGYDNTRYYFKQFHSHIIIGSGPQLRTERFGIFVPYVHLGASYYSDWGELSNNTDPDIRIQRSSKIVSDTWALICGAGLDWQVGKRHLSGINLQVSYTPLNIYTAPAQYAVDIPNGSYNVTMQGKLLQCALTYSTHFTIKKWYRD